MIDASAPNGEPADFEPTKNKNLNLPVPVVGTSAEFGAEEFWQEPPAIDWRPSDRRNGDAAAAVPEPRLDWKRLAAAVSLASVVTIAAAAAAVHVHELQIGQEDAAQARAFAQRFDALSVRFDSLEANRIHDELANQRRVLAEIKAGAAGTHDVGGAVSQLAARVERLEKDQSVRLDKLGDRMDHDAANRLVEISARLEKLEAKATTAAPVVAAASSKPAPASKPEVQKVPAVVSNETTGSIDKPLPRLRGFFLSEIHNGYAMIDGPSGEFAVAPGDTVPGGGRVIRIERRGHDWVVITTRGQIAAMTD